MDLHSSQLPRSTRAPQNKNGRLLVLAAQERPGTVCRSRSLLRRLSRRGSRRPTGCDVRREHHRVFYEAVRSRKKPVEDAAFGFRAAGPALLANVSCFEEHVCGWDAQTMTAMAIA